MAYNKEHLKQKLEWEGGLDYLFHEIPNEQLPKGKIRDLAAKIRSNYLELCTALDIHNGWNCTKLLDKD